MTYLLLDPLRGFAALWVFTFHHDFGPWLDQFPLLAKVFGAGSLGVPLFFVISGYCITASARSSLRKGESVRGFMVRRVRRVYPTFWCSVVVAVVAPFWMEGLSSLKSGQFVFPAGEGFLSYGPSDWISVLTLTRVFAHVPDAVDLQTKFSGINAVYWTLALEVQFYLVVAGAILAGRRFYPCLALVTLLSLPFSPDSAMGTSGLFVPYWPMFAIGVALYWILERRGAARAREGSIGLAIGVAVAGLVGAWTTIWLTGTIPWLALSAGFGLVLLLVKPLDRLLRQGIEGARGGRRVPFVLLIALGNMSYSLYLVHTKIARVVTQPLDQVFSEKTLPRDLAVFALTLLGCHVFYWICERPFATSSTKRIAQAGADAAVGHAG